MHFKIACLGGSSTTRGDPVRSPRWVNRNKGVDNEVKRTILCRDRRGVTTISLDVTNGIRVGNGTESNWFATCHALVSRIAKCRVLCFAVKFSSVKIESHRIRFEGSCEFRAFDIFAIQVRPIREKKKLKLSMYLMIAVMNVIRAFKLWRMSHVCNNRVGDKDFSNGVEARHVGMVRTRSEGKKPDENEDQEIPNLREMIAAKVVKQELTKVIHSRVEAAIASRASGSRGSQGGQTRATSYKDSSTCQPSHFEGHSRWISDVEWLMSESLSMARTMESTNEITDLFLERSHFCPNYVAMNG
ncbi:hypothetical protein OSB04_031368 [Centaurea solstitialis]|uniref:Uncharacterized protein n=1 Tax=Centaurea solstitialis TaxID=347529 RepID=A0AA38S9C8_9ASTR|nr:hypothetical protein OSB04_031368 [Centaurea solstitialis]